MKTKTFGSTIYFVKVFYTNDKNEHRSHVESWSLKDCAKTMYDIYSGYIGQEYDGIDWKGTITYVCVIKGKQCRFE